MYDFSKVSIKRNVAEKLTIFARKSKRTNSEVLDALISFVEKNDIDIFDKNDDALSVNKLINKRFNALVSIIKNIEKTQTKPTSNLMAILFEQLAEETNTQKNNFELQTKAKFTERKK